MQNRGMGTVFIFMAVIVAASIGLIAVVALSQRPAAERRSRAGSSRQHSRTPAEGALASVVTDSAEAPVARENQVAA